MRALTEADQKTVNQAFEQYEKLHHSFFQYDGEKAQKEAKELAAVLSRIEDKELSKKLKFSQEKLREIAKDAPRKENNQRLHLVSMALIHVMKDNAPKGEYKAFQCPMVKKKWIQNTKEVKVAQNPYAPEMPNCGGLDK